MVGDILQPTHLLFVLIVALLVLGPKRLPEVARTLGNGLRDFRAAISGEHSDRDEAPPGYIPYESADENGSEPMAIGDGSAEASNHNDSAPQPESKDHPAAAQRDARDHPAAAQPVSKDHPAAQPVSKDHPAAAQPVGQDHPSAPPAGEDQPAPTADRVAPAPELDAEPERRS